MGGSTDTLRQRILNLVKDYPGLHLRAIQRKSSTTPLVAECHLNALEHLRLIRSEMQDSYRVFFPMDATLSTPHAQETRLIALVRRPNVLALVLALLEHGPLTAAETSEVTGMASSTAYYQIALLREAGLIDDGPGTTQVALVDPEAVVSILQAYNATRDAIAQFGDAWRRVFDIPRASSEDQFPDVPTDVMELPRSMQRVFVELLDGRKTQKELRESTGLARRSVYAALKTLTDLGLVDEAPRLRDTRTRWYSIVEPVPPAREE